MWTPARATRSVSPHETLGPGDLTSDRLPVEARPTTGYLAGWRTDNGWRIDFNFAMASPRREEHLLAADEFRSVAKQATSAGLQRPFIENAFLATEHLAKAELLSYAATLDLIEHAKTHASVASTYNLWARLGNTEKRFAELLNDLGAARGSAVYATNDSGRRIAIDPASALLVLDDLHLHVARVVTGDGPNAIKVIATHDLEAETLVGPDDFTLRPPKAPPSG